MVTILTSPTPLTQKGVLTSDVLSAIWQSINAWDQLHVVCSNVHYENINLGDVFPSVLNHTLHNILALIYVMICIDSLTMIQHGY